MDFVCESCFNLFFIEVSRELFEPNQVFNKTNLELFQKSFKNIISNISSQSVELKIVFYARVFFPDFVDLVEAFCFEVRTGQLQFGGTSSFQVDSTGNIFKDFYHSIKVKLPMMSRLVC